MKWQKKFVSTLVLAFIFLCIWILWSSDEMKDSLLLHKKNYDYMKDFILSPPVTYCKKSSFLTIIVTSYVGHVELRSAHRRAMPADLLESMNVTRVFLLSKIPVTEKYITQAAIINELSIYKDILQGSFVENYRNLTLKHLMGLRWASNVCRPTYILKVDDDTVFSLEGTYKLLLKLGIQETVLMGYMLNNTVPRRNIENKWYVTQQEYNLNKYPEYLSGWYYITTSSVATRLCDMALYQPHFWIDDIYITGILRNILGLKLIQVPEDYWLEYYELLECCMTDMTKKFIRCEYVVGPNGGRNNLILEFNEALRNCDNQKNCMVRPIDKPLKRVCFVKRERDIFSKGQGKVELIQA
ncbi:unnamed protein product [Chilo suppressalis]|uniref:Hexosyltransferase n=1 Tax=Chilo suppressalis TaxID=168631 RepID=A0ABN8AWA8_CHISP|nr:hypothetical protein evm_007899 [Chilo suppressalis]CAH0400466.1 unnamed protein product [Chilo suppressalis]